jgi:hypothetical protein
VYGIDYVAISRATSPFGLMLDEVLQETFVKIANSRKMTLVRAERKRLGKLAKETDKWTRTLLKRFFKKFYKPRHRRKNQRPFTTTSEDVSYDVLATIHECDTSRYTGDTLASIVGEHTMTQMMAHAKWRRTMHSRNYKKTKYFEILASQPGPIRGRRRKRQKAETATYAAYQFAAYTLGDKLNEKDITKPKKLLKLLLENLDVTTEMVKYQNPPNNPFSFKKPTLMDSLLECDDVTPPMLQKKSRTDLAKWYATLKNIKALPYESPKKKQRITKS